MVSSGDVAKRAGVSRSHVSNYFNHPELVSAENRERIAEAIEALQYVRHEPARQLRGTSSTSIGLVLLDAWMPYFAEVSTGVEDAADARGWFVHFLNSRRDPEREERHIGFLEAWRVSGLIIVPQQPRIERLEALIPRGITPLLLDPPREHPTSPQLPSVVVDHVEGGRLAAAHLIERGGTRFAVVGNPRRVGHSADRYAGFAQYLEQAGVGGPPTLIETQSMDVAAGTAAAAEVIALPPKRRPDAIFASNDSIAFGLVHGLLAAGVRIPDDIRVIGYDDVAMSAQIALPLTTIRQPSHQLGATAADLTIDIIEGTQMRDIHVILHPELVVRSTT
ncbi:LacI family transcriptional regulator [Kineosphaera limosa]|uniref:Putative LacI family transcriptional regulator n=1 Tax=Kineosphaera limosa NBRC 100340 TaxID=1184609 RepID=K6WT29_9MICO|nr:LacI family DNA-binding transcriptional regulator [Kineosphaera limosa]NYE00859.1 LacI family transcriptional regulator [Kineosphaera limosa]GAB96986.1 putative LacI family transcriptional regulator [Kineosphaera limosa NBRC 100340]